MLSGILAAMLEGEIPVQELEVVSPAAVEGREAARLGPGSSCTLSEGFRTERRAADGRP